MRCMFRMLANPTIDLCTDPAWTSCASKSILPKGECDEYENFVGVLESADNGEIG